MTHYLFISLILFVFAMSIAFTLIILTKSKHKSCKKNYWTWASIESNSTKETENTKDEAQSEEIICTDNILKVSDKNVTFNYSIATGTKNGSNGHSYVYGYGYPKNSPQYLRQYLYSYIQTIVKYYVLEYEDLDLFGKYIEKGQVAYIRHSDCFYIYDGEDWQLYDDDSWEGLYEKIFCDK